MSFLIGKAVFAFLPPTEFEKRMISIQAHLKLKAQILILYERFILSPLDTFCSKNNHFGLAWFLGVNLKPFWTLNGKGSSLKNLNFSCFSDWSYTASLLRNITQFSCELGRLYFFHISFFMFQTFCSLLGNCYTFPTYPDPSTQRILKKLMVQVTIPLNILFFSPLVLLH